MLLAKNLLGIGHAEGVTLTYVVDAFRQEGCGGRVLRVPAGTRLNAALSLCKRARTHLLVVTSDEATSDGLLARISAMGSAAASAAESWESQLVGTGPVVGGCCSPPQNLTPRRAESTSREPSVARCTPPRWTG